jgi:uncharacterized protein (DUF433 family)
MDNKFNRIIREPLVMGGQARIRDTNITVNEIVRLSLSGISQADILTKYPQLEAEDVHQALAWAINDLKDATGMWRNEILNPLTSVIGYSKFGIDRLPRIPIKDIFPETNENLTTFEIIHQNAIRTNAKLQHFGSYHKIQYPTHERELEQVSLTEIIESAKREALEINPNIQVEIELHEVSQDELLLENGYISVAIAYIAASEWNFEERTKITITKQNDNISFAVLRRLKSESKSEHLSQLLAFSETSSMMQVAQLILFQNKSELNIRSEGSTVIFEFELPIWKDEQD